MDNRLTGQVPPEWGSTAAWRNLTGGLGTRSQGIVAGVETVTRLWARSSAANCTMYHRVRVLAVFLQLHTATHYHGWLHPSACTSIAHSVAQPECR